MQKTDIDAVMAWPSTVREGEKSRAHKAALIIEEPLEIRINGSPYAVVMRTPGYETELAAGFCFTEGIIDSFSEILTIIFCAGAPAVRQSFINITVPQKTRDQNEGSGSPAGRTFASRSSCGLCKVAMLQDVKKKVVPVQVGLRVPSGNFYRMLESMLAFQTIYGSTRSAHAAGLFYPGGELIIVREDVGRHNALDKAIGHSLMQGLDCGKCIAFLSSRISFEMVQKALRARIPIIAAVSAATSLAVDLAQRTGCTLIGRVRDTSITIYTHPDRIVA